MAPLRKLQVRVDPESYRKLRGISQEELADKSGIARTTLRRHLKAAMASLKAVQDGKFTLDQFAAICAVLDIPAEALQVAS